MSHSPLLLDLAAEADADIEEIGFYFAQNAPEVEERFLKAFYETVRLLASSPNLGERCQFRSPRTKGMRMWLVSGFSNYLIFYRLQENTLQIVRVIHGARDYASIFNNE